MGSLCLCKPELGALQLCPQPVCAHSYSEQCSTWDQEAFLGVPPQCEHQATLPLPLVLFLWFSNLIIWKAVLFPHSQELAIDVSAGLGGFCGGLFLAIYSCLRGSGVLNTQSGMQGTGHPHPKWDPEFCDKAITRTKGLAVYIRHILAMQARNSSQSNRDFSHQNCD